MTEQNPTRLRSDPDVGLTAQQVREQEARGLSNIQPSHNTKTVGQIVRDNTLTLFNLFNFALAACIALVGAYENLLFLIIIFVNSGVGIVQEIRSKRMVEKLSLISMPKAVALRDGREQAVPVEELVLDDILVLRMGGQICADAIVAAGEVEVNEALLTGEAEPIRKSRGDMLLSGSFVVSGACRARVEHIGSDNYATKIALDAKKYKKVHSDLMNALDKIVKFTSFFILPLGALLFLHARFVLDHSLEGAVVYTAAALIGMMPKGLVLLTSVSLAVGVIKLARKKTLVQELFCIENLSRVDMLCLDKTGTITQGKMTVSDILPLTAQPPFDLEEAVGSFIGALDDNNATFLALGERFPAQGRWRAVCRTPFSSARKWSSVTFEGRGTVLVGAPEILLRGRSGLLPPTVAEREAAGCRVVLVAHSEERVEGVLPGTVRPVAALVLEDPIRPDARETLAFFTREDVQLKIISGDNPVTVSSIARQAGLPHSDSYIDASTLADEEALRQAAERYTIFGRVSPQQKRQLVHALQDEGHTVAMTGDGVNDVLALKDADCSIAMASGSDAARQISQLVLLDSNFSSLPSVVMEGRRVINNITRTAVLFLVKTIFSFLLSFMALAFSMPYPFIPIQLSLISMVVEGIPSFFLTFEPNRDRIKGQFLSTVLRQAFPCAFIIVLNIILVAQIGPLLGLAALDLATLNVYLTAFIWLYLLLRVCMPLNKLRAALFGAMVTLFGVAAYLFRDLLQIGTLTLRSLPLFLILAAASLVLYSLVAWAIGRAAAAVRARKAGRQRNAPDSRRRGHGA